MRESELRKDIADVKDSLMRHMDAKFEIAFAKIDEKGREIATARQERSDCATEHEGRLSRLETLYGNYSLVALGLALLGLLVMVGLKLFA